MKKIISILCLTLVGILKAQEGADSIAIANSGNYQLERKKEIAKTDFVYASSDENKNYSIKLDGKNSFGTKIWVKTEFKFKKIKNKQGKWIESKRKDYTLSLINIDCSDKEYEFLKMIHYDANGNVKNQTEGNGAKEYIVPGSHIDAWAKIICN